jgi:hypothetical protein
MSVQFESLNNLPRREGYNSSFLNYLSGLVVVEVVV